MISTFKRRGGFGWTEDQDVVGTLESEGGKHQGGSCQLPFVADVYPTLRGQPNQGPGRMAGDDAARAGLVRRLTPRECERLQGFPDGWTAVGGMSDSARYRMLGNAVAVPVAEWIGKRIVEREEEQDLRNERILHS